MTYDEAIKYLYNIPRFSKKTTLDNTGAILKLLDNPQEKIEFFHVAGSNGKGSVCAFINSILINSGIHTGLFTSPHLVKANERISIDGENVSDSEFTWAFNRVYNVIKENESYGIVHPSFFEFIFLMCLVIFKKNNVKCGIIEVGLGGRLDATNVIKNPAVSVITSISLEHTEILGDTIGKIAEEKAGIIKKSVPVVYDGTDKEAERIIRLRAKEKGSEVYPVYPENIKIIKKEDKYIDFSLNTVYYDNDTLKIPFPAPYQTINAALAGVAVKIAKKRCHELCELSDTNIYEGIKNTVWAGRMEFIKDNNRNIYIDGAHNVSGIKRFVEAVNIIKTEGRKYLLFGVVREKDYEHMIPMLVKGAAWEKIYITGMKTSRGTDTKQLKCMFEQSGACNVICADDSGEAYDMAVSEMEDKDVLFCAGSLYLAGEIKKHIRKEEKYD